MFIVHVVLRLCGTTLASNYMSQCLCFVLDRVSAEQRNLNIKNCPMYANKYDLEIFPIKVEIYLSRKVIC